MKLSKLSLTASVLLGLSLSQHVFADVSGTVYLDLPVNGLVLNTYGVKDANELGVEGIKVTAYPGGANTITAADGSWLLTTTGDARVEFSNIPSYLKESSDGGVANSSVQFVVNGGTADFGVHSPSTFSDLNPDVIIPAQISGDPNGEGTAATIGSLVLHTYDASGTNTPSSLDGAPTVINFGDLGSTYGGAWQRQSKNYFTSAFAKRYVGFKNEPGSVFKVSDPAGGTPTVSEYFSLDALGFSAGVINPRGLPANAGQPAHDVDMFAQVGTVSLGDLELDETEENLYTVNLFDKKLYKINIGNPAKATVTAADVSSFIITTPICVNGNWRPFGLGLDKSRNIMMVGGVCDAATGTRDDLHAYIYSFDLTTQVMGAAPVLDFPLNFQRGGVTTGYSGSAAGAIINTHWNSWSDAPADWLLAVPPVAGNANRIHPEPALVDIEVDVDGSLILGFRDIWGDRWGAINYAPDIGDTSTYHTMSNGDLYRAQRNSAGVYIFEDNGQFPSGLISSGAGNGDGPGGGEYYNEDFFASHSNVPKGGLAYLQGGSHFVAVSQDPLDVDSGGTKWISVVPGNSTQNYQIYKSTFQDGTFYKANGLGDAELLFDPAPIEIGNRVWLDANGDGVQDADEAGVVGISVELICGGAIVSTAITDASGNYIFSNDPSEISTNSHKYNVAVLVAGVDNCLVRIPNISGGSKQAALGENSLTTANTGEGANSNQNDSDGISSGDNADTSITAAEIRTAGANNHSFDFGFRAAPSCEVNQPVVTPSCDNAGTPSDPSDDTFTYTINATGTGVGATYSISGGDTQAGLSYGADHVSANSFPISSGNLSLTLTDVDDATCALVNVAVTAPATCSSVVVTPKVDLEISKTASPTIALSGDTVTYTITVINNGPDDATGVDVTDQLPAGVTATGNNVASQGAYAANIWTVGDLANGSSATLTIEVTVD